MITYEQLLPAQRQTLDALERAVASDRVVELFGRGGAGKTTILHQLHERLGGKLVTSRDFIEASVSADPLALDETVYTVLRDALRRYDAVVVDDFNFVAAVSCCSHSYPRQNFLAAAIVPLVAMAKESGKPFVIGTEGYVVQGLDGRVPRVMIPKFTTDDYLALCQAYLSPAQVERLDMKKIHRFAPYLTARQIADSCVALRGNESLDTETLIKYLREHHMVSNVDLEEVQAVDLRDLKGLDDVLEALEANVVLPLEDSELAEELNLKPKRGVLLAGPPGTGKTTIGRALAHRLKSKFFLIDGTVVSGTPMFHHTIHRVFEAAKQNAPAVIFIDDTDVLFEDGQQTGLYRYLLTVLDGLESASAGRICLMMTAMDVGNLPPALVRSGRIELWLETRLPSATARAAILTDRCAELPAAIGDVDIEVLAEASDGLSGADLKRVVDDGKLLFAFARSRGMPLQAATAYFLAAIETVRKNKEQYAAAEARARARRPVRPSYFDSVQAIGSAAAMAAAQFESEMTRIVETDGSSDVFIAVDGT